MKKLILLTISILLVNCNNEIKKNVIKLIKIYKRMGAKNDKRLPDKYSLVKAAGLKNK